jgi:uncharacterized protein (TIGR03083 family)
MPSDTWATISAERTALADDLEPLTDEQWQTPSLCEGRSVRDVVAHMAATAMITPPTFFAKLAGAGFSFERMTAKDIEALRGDKPADTLATFRSVIGSVKHPPGPTDSWLGETIIHAEDVRRPLGISREYPREAVVRLADFYKGSNLIVGTKRRIDGLALRATDTTWSHGTGPEVSGPILPLLMAMTGRKVAIADLSGDGTKILRERA